jgi:hypothetical protein
MLIAAAAWAQPDAVIRSFLAAPSAVSFHSADPDASAANPSPVLVTFELNGKQNRNWWLRVRSDSTNLLGCSFLPAAALRVACASVSVNVSSGPGGTGSCTPAINLSTSDQVLAQGRQSRDWGYYTITLAIAFQDTWRYQAPAGNSCSTNLVYTLDAP